MNRRELLPLIGAPALFALGGCGPSAVYLSKRFRVIAMAKVNGRRVEGSTVMEATWEVEQPIPGGRLYELLRGEALILDLAPGRAVFLMPFAHDRNTGAFNGVYTPAIKHIARIEGRGLDQAEIARIKALTGQHPLPMFGRERRWPAMVAFRDERQPATIFEVYPEALGSYLPGARFLGIDIEFTDQPVSDVLRKRLPWLVPDKKLGFPADPPGAV